MNPTVGSNVTSHKKLEEYTPSEIRDLTNRVVDALRSSDALDGVLYDELASFAKVCLEREGVTSEFSMSYREGASGMLDDFIIYSLHDDNATHILRIWRNEGVSVNVYPLKSSSCKCVTIV